MSIGDLYKVNGGLRVYENDWMNPEHKPVNWKPLDMIEPNEPFVLLEHKDEFTGYILCKVLTIKGIVGFVRFGKSLLEKYEHQQ